MFGIAVLTVMLCILLNSVATRSELHRFEENYPVNLRRRNTAHARALADGIWYAEPQIWRRSESESMQR